MLPIMNFWSNHKIDFEKYEHDYLEYFTISELRILPIPAEIIRMENEAVLKQFTGGFLSAFGEFTKWCPMSYPDTSDDFQKILNEHVVAVGPLAMRIIFSPEHILLPSIIYERVE